MTAEIAILNTGAVALAADSVVTVSGGTERKTYNSVNKLFTLSKYEPVGVMIYGSGDFMQVPWELIVKLYRHQLGTSALPHLEDYGQAFLTFLRENRVLFPNTSRVGMFEAMVNSAASHLKESLLDSVKRQIQATGAIAAGPDLDALLDEVLTERESYFRELQDLHDASENLDTVFGQYSVQVDGSITSVFQELPLNDAQRDRIRALVKAMLGKDVPSIGNSGVVIAGYGREDVFPRLVQFDLEAVVGDWLRYQQRNHVHVGLGDGEPEASGAVILPFAQREVVDTFVQGIDPYQLDAISGFLTEIFNEYPALVTRVLASRGTDTAECARIEQELRNSGSEILERFSNQFAEYRRQQHVDPIVDAVAVLPKDELAAMAEALVNLTSFKRKISLEVETVGEPIDVAVISKGDGFIWIKRKHYFNQSLNPGFLANYYRE